MRRRAKRFNKRKIQQVNKMIPQKVEVKLKRAFTVRGLDFFRFYQKLRMVYVGLYEDREEIFSEWLEDEADDLYREFRRSLRRLMTIKSPYDGRSVSPLTVNKISDAMPEIRKVLRRVDAGAHTKRHWRYLNDVLPPLYEEIARDKGVYIKAHPYGPVKWCILRPMTGKQEAVERLKDLDPESYHLVQTRNETLDAINEEIKATIEDSGYKVKEAFIRGRKVYMAVDPVTDEAMVYDRDGEVLTPEEYYDKLDAREEAKKDLARVESRINVELDDLRRLPKSYMDNLKGQTEYVAMTDDGAKQGRLSRVLPTRMHYVNEYDPESGELVKRGYKVVSQGRYAGCYLDDLVNSQGRMIEGTVYKYQEMEGRSVKIPVVMDPSDREPYVTKTTLREQRGGRTIEKEKLHIKVSGAREFTEVRNALKEIASNIGRASGSIPSVIYASEDNLRMKVEQLVEAAEAAGDDKALRTAQSILEDMEVGMRVNPRTWATAKRKYKARLKPYFKKYKDDIKGSREASFYFDPKDFAAVRDKVQGMSMSKSAMEMVQGYFNELTLADQATAEENLGYYDADEIGGFITGKYSRTNGEWRPFDLSVFQKKALAWLEANDNQGVVGLDTGMGKCVRFDTLVDTNRGLIRIEDLNPGIDTPDTWAPVEDWSVLVNGEALPVKNFYYGGERDTRKITTRYGFEIEGSLVHPLLTRTAAGLEEWVKTPELQAGDYLCVSRQQGVFPEQEPSLPTVDRKGRSEVNLPERMSPSLARLLAYIVAEGWTNHDRFFTVSQHKDKNPEVRADLESLIQAEFGYTAGPEDDIRVSSVDLCAWLKEMGINGRTSRDKIVPPAILRSTQASMKQFLRGMFDAEGSVDANGIEFSTASERLGREIQTMLLKFGVVANRSPKFVEGFDHTYWKLLIQGEDARQFMDRIGLVSDRKIQAAQDTFMRKVSNPNADVVPHMAPLVGVLSQEMRECFEGSATEFRVRYGNSLWGTINHVRFGRRNATYRFLRELLGVAVEVGCGDTQAFNAIEEIVQKGYFYDPIDTIIESRAVVMDVEVDDPQHCFVGNGLMNHNTLLAVASMQKLIRDGLAEPGTTYEDNEGETVTTNGRFLFVCPKSLRGNVPNSIRKYISDSTALRERLDVVSYREFSGGWGSGNVPRRLKKKDYWKQIIARRTAKPKKRIWDMREYVAIFFDEAHNMSNPTWAASRAAQRLYHPRKILLTASPMEETPMQTYVLNAIASNKPLSYKASDHRGKSKQEKRRIRDEIRRNQAERRRFKERYCEVLGGRIIGLKDDPDNPNLKQELHTWVKRNVFYADKTDDQNPKTRLKQLERETKTVEMDPVVEDCYRTITADFNNVMRALVSKLRDKGLMEDGSINPDARDPNIERLFGAKFKPVLSLLNGLSNYPADTFKEIHRMMVEGTTRTGRNIDRRTVLGRILTALEEAYTPEEMLERAEIVGNPKLDQAVDTVKDKLARAGEGAKTLLFSDDAHMCVLTCKEMSERVGGLHAVALKREVRIFRSGREVDVWRIPVPNAAKEKLLKTERAIRKFEMETDSVSTHTLPFRPKQYKAHPDLKADDKYNKFYLKSDWQIFALKEIVNNSPEFKTCTLLGKEYETGHNLQSFSQVVHLDRDTWNSESMKQRTARAWRQGNDKPVDEVTLDAVYAEKPDQPSDALDRSLDELRRYYQKVEGALFDNIIKDAQGTVLGIEWDEMHHQAASYYRLDDEVLELMTSPYLNRSEVPDISMKNRLPRGEVR